MAAVVEAAAAAMLWATSGPDKPLSRAVGGACVLLYSAAGASLTQCFGLPLQPQLAVGCSSITAHCVVFPMCAHRLGNSYFVTAYRHMPERGCWCHTAMLMSIVFAVATFSYINH
jgi:hypothetical protein